MLYLLRKYDSKTKYHRPVKKEVINQTKNFLQNLQRWHNKQKIVIHRCTQWQVQHLASDGETVTLRRSQAYHPTDERLTHSLFAIMTSRTAELTSMQI